MLSGGWQFPPAKGELIGKVEVMRLGAHLSICESREKPGQGEMLTIDFRKLFFRCKQF